MFVSYNPPKIKVKGYKQDDCTAIAIANGLGISYDLSRKILQTVDIESTSNELLFRKKNPLKRSDFQVEYHVHGVCKLITSESTDYRKLKGVPKMTLKEFAQNNPKGRYIVLVTSHLTTVVDGVIFDTWNSGNRKVQCVYSVNVEKSKQIISELAKFYKMNNEAHLEDHLLNKIKETNREKEVNTEMKTSTTGLGQTMEEIYKEHNALAIEEKLQDLGLELPFKKEEENYTYSNGVDTVIFDNDGVLVRSTVDVPQSIQEELKKRIAMSSFMVKSIW